MRKEYIDRINPSHTPEQISAIIQEQINRERQVKVMEEISQQESLSEKKFLNSKLINRVRIYGAD